MAHSHHGEKLILGSRGSALALASMNWKRHIRDWKCRFKSSKLRVMRINPPGLMRFRLSEFSSRKFRQP